MTDRCNPALETSTGPLQGKALSQKIASVMVDVIPTVLFCFVLFCFVLFFACFKTDFLCVALDAEYCLETCSVDKAGLRLTEICLPLPLECWN